MLKIKTNNVNPNFTIILPGPCQAACNFCYWKENKDDSRFLKGLIRSLNELPDFFNQISISGGESSLSPYFEETIKIINQYKLSGKIKKVVLTTNGINLLNKSLHGIDHINISRHSYKQSINNKIFKTEKIPTKSHLKLISEHCNKYGIDVNFNVVFVEDVNTNEDIFKWIKFAKKTNTTSVTFRNQYGKYGISKMESKLLDMNYIPSIISTCPVCRTSKFIVDGILVKFHSSDYEPTDSSKFDEDEVYEVILQSNGNLTRDWEERKVLINLKN